MGNIFFQKLDFTAVYYSVISLIVYYYSSECDTTMGKIDSSHVTAALWRKSVLRGKSFTLHEKYGILIYYVTMENNNTLQYKPYENYSKQSNCTKNYEKLIFYHYNFKRCLNKYTEYIHYQFIESNI